MTRVGAAILSSLVLFVQVCVLATAKDDDGGVAPDQSSYDCGTLALYTLCRIEGLSLGVRAVESALSPASPNGYSMRRLRDAARAHRFNLVGVKLPKSDRAPDGPALVYVQSSVNGHGHYIVIRPVGHTGKLVQIIDSAKDQPEVVDAKDLYASTAWTGLALIPSRPNWPLRIVAGLALVSGLTLALQSATRLRGARPRRA